MKHLVIDTPRSISLADYDPGDTGKLSKQEAELELEQLKLRLGQLQEHLYGARQHSVLIILQGMDTSGKDGTIKHVLSAVNPVGCRVWSFKAPSEEERSHDFLWRVHQRVPALGEMTIFNRSHYEDVLAARVRGLVPEEVWQGRYKQINHFEQMLSENGVVLIKFFLHISKEEQKQRLLVREAEVEKAWKLAVGDWQDRRYWEAYSRAYEDALAQCSASWAPWHIVPANKKWYRNYLVARTLVERLEPFERQWTESLKEQSARALAEVRAFHSQEQQPAAQRKPKQKTGKKA